jgi:hypothetical protein
MTVDVFISYKQEEREAVQIIASTLSDLKIAVWFDTKLRAGTSFDEEIAAALQAAKAVLVCWTPAAIQSEWVRGEATQGAQGNRLAACFLQPTNLIPPFNLTHAENLCAWAGQGDDPAWLKLLERIGELTGRPGLPTYSKVMRVGAAVDELKAWANANGADPLVETVWSRVALLEGEGSGERLAREKAEARITDERRKALAEKSRRLARERGLRDPVAERQRFRWLVGFVAAVALISIAAIAYIIDAQDRDQTLREKTKVSEVRAFLNDNSLHPIAERARNKLAQLDLAEWNDALLKGTVEALEEYLAEAEPEPAGAFVDRAKEQLEHARDRRQVQQILSRLLLYRGPQNGASNEELLSAIWLFRYRWNLPVSDEIDEALIERLKIALNAWINPRPQDLRAAVIGPPSDADYARLASDYQLDGATIRAIAATEGGKAFGADGRPIIVFEPRIFSQRTQRRFDSTYPNVSNPNASARDMPAGQGPRWAQLEEAYALDPTAAYESTSFGVMQLMGEHGKAKATGFETAGEYMRFMAQSEANQVEAMLRYAQARNLIGALQRHDWNAFSRSYIGPGSEKSYGVRLAREYARISAEMAIQYNSVLPDGRAPSTP